MWTEDEEDRKKGIFRGYAIEDDKWTPKRITRDIQKSLRDCWRRHGRPKDWRSQWRELEKHIIAECARIRQQP
jgi:hypothetical protein